MIVLGIPSHEDDSVRGVSTAIDISKRMATRNVIPHIGVSFHVTSNL